jgi:hypothetical protein
MHITILVLSHSCQLCQLKAFVSFDGLQLTFLCSTRLVKDQATIGYYSSVASRHSRLDRLSELQRKVFFSMPFHHLLRKVTEAHYGA